MFNAYEHYDDEFKVECNLTPLDAEIYKARELYARTRFPWSSAMERLFKNCLIHLSANVPGKIAYFATVEAMRANKPTRTSPEMFLSRYLSMAPSEVRAAFQIEVLGKTMPLVRFIENNDAEGWVSVYANGPGSCMRGKDIVRCYAHPDNHLALAYFYPGDDSEDIVNRAIVNRSTMTYNRIYGDEAAVFAAALKALGYSNDAAQTLHGEKIYVRLIDCVQCNSDMVVGPYLDCDSQEVRVLPTGKSEAIIEENADYLTYEEFDEGWVCNGCSN